MSGRAVDISKNILRIFIDCLERNNLILTKDGKEYYLKRVHEIFIAQPDSYETYLQDEKSLQKDIDHFVDNLIRKATPEINVNADHLEIAFNICHKGIGC